MLGGIKGMLITMVSTFKGFRNPVTVQYPNEHLPIPA